jgi:hypothetical protein
MTIVARTKIILLVLLVSLPGLGRPAMVYETQPEFLQRAFGSTQPEPELVWLSGERKAKVGAILGHNYPALRLRYWCQDKRSAWVLEEIGKELPITVGIIIDKNHIRNLRVLTYRENRGGEVATPSFTDQFVGGGLSTDGSLDTRIDSISGATLSVRALTRLATMALFLNADTGCHDDA